MATEFYVEQADRSPHSGVANEDIYAGELVHDDGDGVDVLTYAATDEDAGGHVGLARYGGQAFAREYEDEVREDKYVAGDPQRERVQYQPVEDSAVVRIRTPEDNGTDPAPDVNHQTVVGVVDASAVQGSAGEFQGRVVEEGYDDGTTTFNRSNNNFKAIGVAYRPDQNPAPVAGQQAESFDYPVRVVLFSDLKESA
jgi:hypothetical protein